MKILFTLDALINAGTERSVLDLAKHFSQGVEVHVAYFYPRHDLQEAYLEAGISVHFMDLKGKYNFLRGVKRLKKLLREIQPDLIVSSLLRANLMTRWAAKASGIPLLGTFVNDTYGLNRQAEHSGKQWWKYRLFWKLDQWTAGIPLHYIANAESIAQSNAEALGIPMDKMSVVYRGRDALTFPSWKPPQDPKPFVFAAIGRLLGRKGFHEAITALKKIHKFRKDVHLVIYGEGKDRAALEQKVGKLGLEDSVFLPGNIPQAWQKLYEAHAFIFPSWYEGFSGALVEAMMVGLPIIASSIPMNLEAIDRHTARIHQVKSPEDLALHMLWVMDHYEEACAKGQKAREIAFERFDIRHIARQYEDTLREVLEGRR